MQISTSAPPTLTAVTPMRSVTIPWDRTYAHVKQDTQEMEGHALVSCKKKVTNICISVSSGKSNLTGYSPLFFRKTVEIEDFALQAAILDKCQIYLEGGGRFSRLSSSTAINQDARSLGEWL